MEEKKIIKLGLKTTILLIVVFIAVVIGMVWQAINKYNNSGAIEKKTDNIKIVGVK